MSEPTLTEFLLARIAEDEANAATDGTLQRAMRAAWPGLPDGISLAEAERRTVAALYTAGFPDRVRVLAECEAKRRIVEEHRPGGKEGKRYCGCCWLDDLEAWEPYPCPTLKALALPYADHPDFREEWRL